MNQLRTILLKEIMIAPNEPRVGCTLCLRRCWFGYLLQSNKTLTNTLNQSIQSGNPKQRVSAEKLQTLISDQYHGQIGEPLLPHAAYCLFAQCTTDERALIEFRHRAVEKKP